jgi:hypothetical protein
MSDSQQALRLHQWVEIHQGPYERTFRMRVPGGWLYRYQTDPPSPNVVMVFVADRRAGSTPLSAGQPNRRKTRSPA